MDPQTLATIRRVEEQLARSRGVVADEQASRKTARSTRRCICPNLDIRHTLLTKFGMWQAKIKKLETLLKLSRSAQRHAAAKPALEGPGGKVGSGPTMLASPPHELGLTADLMFDEILTGEDTGQNKDDSVTIFGESSFQQMGPGGGNELLPVDVFAQVAIDRSMHRTANQSRTVPHPHPREPPFLSLFCVLFSRCVSMVLIPPRASPAGFRDGSSRWCASD